MQAIFEEGRRLAELMFRTLVVTFSAMLFMGASLGVVAFLLIGGGDALRGTTAALSTVLVWGVAGYLLAVRQAVLRGTLSGLERSPVGHSLMGDLFDKLLQVGTQSETGERGNLVARTLERIPLKQAEALLARTVNALMRVPGGADEASSYLLPKVRKNLLGVIQTLTLARLREADSAATGVDLLLVRNELELHLETALRERFNLALLTSAVGYGIVTFLISACTVILLRILW